MTRFSAAFRTVRAAAVGVLLLAGAPVSLRAAGPPPRPAPADSAAAVDDPCAAGRNLFRQARFLEARRALQDCLAQGHEQVDVLLPLAVMGVREGRLDEGLAYGERAVAVAPDDPEARYWYGRALLRSDRVEEARAQWEQGLALSTEHAGILEALARLALAEGEQAKAYNLLSQLRLLGVDDAWLHGLLAEISAGKGLWGQALAHLRDGMAREEPGVDELLFGAELCILAGEGDEALDYNRRAVALEPGPRTHGALGETFFALEQVDSALVYLRRAVAEPGADPRHRFNLANALEVAGFTEEAERNFRAFLAARPDDAVGHFNYGIHLEGTGRRAEALGEVSRAIELDPSLLNAQVVKAQILESLGRWDEALAVVDTLQARDRANLAELRTWEQRLTAARDKAAQAVAAGKIHLLHLAVPDGAALDRVQRELAAGADFPAVVMRFSTGPAAARGGDIGWVDPAEMVPELGRAVTALELNEISPPLRAGGLIHLFKRVP